MPTDNDGRDQYRALIDALVDECRNGGGTVPATWARRGVWNTYALDHPDEMPEEQRMNEVLARTPDEDREVLARMLIQTYEGGVHDTLRVLHDHELPPFDDGYEGAPYHDFMGRLRTDWDWPR